MSPILSKDSQPPYAGLKCLEEVGLCGGATLLLGFKGVPFTKEVQWEKQDGVVSKGVPLVIDTAPTSLCQMRS